MNIRLRLLLMVFAVWLVAASSFALLARTIYLQETLAGREHVREFGRTLNLIIERELDKRAAMARRARCATATCRRSTRRPPARRGAATAG